MKVIIINEQIFSTFQAGFIDGVELTKNIPNPIKSYNKTIYNTINFFSDIDVMSFLIIHYLHKKLNHVNNNFKIIL